MNDSPGGPTPESVHRPVGNAPFVRIELDPAPRVEGLTSFFAGHQLSGYVSWSWDGSTLRAETDRFGLYPLFYLQDVKGIALSTSLPALVPFLRSREWDYDALGLFLRLGYFLGDDTPFRAIRAAPPSLLWREGHLYAPPLRLEARSCLHLPREHVETEYGRLFAAAVRKRLPQGRLFVPLSGGRDSRHLFLELVRAGAKIEAAITNNSWRTTEGEVAAELCRRAGVRHITVVPTYFTLAAAQRRNWETSFCSDEHFFTLSLQTRLREEGAETIFDGFAGDVLSQSKLLLAHRVAWMRQGRFFEFADELIASDELLLRKLLAPDFYALLPLQRARERLADEISKHQHQPNPVNSFFFWNRSRREIALAPFAVLGEFTPQIPFLDEDLYSLLASLTAEFLLQSPLHDAVIAREFPEFRDVPYSRSRAVAKPERPNAKDLLELLGYLAAGPGLIRKSAVLPRVAAAVVDPSRRSQVEPVAKWPVYLRQLSEL